MNSPYLPVRIGCATFGGLEMNPGAVFRGTCRCCPPAIDVWRRIVLPLPRGWLYVLVWLRHRARKDIHTLCTLGLLQRDPRPQVSCLVSCKAARSFCGLGSSVCDRSRCQGSVPLGQTTSEAALSVALKHTCAKADEKTQSTRRMLGVDEPVRVENRTPITSVTQTQSSDDATRAVIFMSAIYLWRDHEAPSSHDG
mmetsp:Transcript_24080/g.56171  ORF Transcript_24080/g.56171 Transcript_24080/m.56171 type:complete len:196 (-) Transcript_24080:286-873(-)